MRMNLNFNYKVFYENVNSFICPFSCKKTGGTLRRFFTATLGHLLLHLTVKHHNL